jgi:hypothetical protein
MASMKITAFWDIIPCSLIEIDQRFRGASHNLWRQYAPLKHQSISMRLYTAISQKAIIFNRPIADCRLVVGDGVRLPSQHCGLDNDVDQ